MGAATEVAGAELAVVAELAAAKAGERLAGAELVAVVELVAAKAGER